MAGSLVVRRARVEDARQLAADLRPLDRAEVEALVGEADATLDRAVAETPDCLAVVLEGKLAALFGTVPETLLSGTGHIWMLGTTQMDRLGRALGFISRRYVSEVSRTYPLLVNYVDARNAPSIRLISWLGFEVQPAQPFGRAGLPFHRFELRSRPDQCASATEPPR